MQSATMNLPRQLEKSKTHGKGNKNYKTIPCTRYASGWCEYDDECWFIHDRDTSYKHQSSPTTIIAPPTTTTNTLRPSPFDMLGLTSALPRLTIPDSPLRTTNTAKRVQPCFAFQRTGCSKGDLCSYRHDLSSPASSVSSRTTADRFRTSGKQPCFDLMRTGVCPKGESCIFSHEDIGRYIQWFRDVDCKLYPLGKCKHGDTCLFRHAAPTLNIDRVTSEHLHISQPQSPLDDPFQNEGRRCPFSTETMLCTNREMCYIHGSPISPSSVSQRTMHSPLSPYPPSSYGQRSYGHHTKTGSISSMDDSSSSAASLSSPSSYTSRMSRGSSFGMGNSKMNVEDPLGIMRCIDDSDDEYIVYEAPFRT